MGDLGQAGSAALQLIIEADARLWSVVALSLRVSLAATAIAAAIGLPLGALVALKDFPGRQVAIVVLNACMGLPPVVVGLVVYVMLSRAGPLGPLGLLFTPGAMIVAQTLLILPIVAAVSRQIVGDAWGEYREQLTSLGAGPVQAAITLIYDCRFSLTTAVLAGFGRAAAEVGAVIMVGGNIAHVTRTMTTAIALETAKGELALALGLGILLMAISLIVNAGAYLLGEFARAREAGAT